MGLKGTKMALPSQVKPVLTACPGGKAAAPAVRIKYHSPCEFAGELRELGLPICEKVIRARCNLPASDPRHIATHTGFMGRHYIPESELFRLAGLREVST